MLRAPIQCCSLLSRTAYIIQPCGEFSLSTHRRVGGAHRTDGWWVPEHKPGPHDPAPDETKRAQLAQKYGLLPGDYKVNDDKDVNFAHSGDYPDLGNVTYAHKDPYETWSDPRFRRNWGEPTPWKFAIYRPDRVTFTGLETTEPDQRNFKGWWFHFKFFFGYGGVLVFWWYFMRGTNATEIVVPTMPKQYPYDFRRAWPFDDARMYPIKNYTFEPASSHDDAHGHGHHH